MLFLTACAAPAFAQATGGPPPPRRTVYVTDTAEPPVPAEVARELRKSVLRFKQEMREIDFPAVDGGAHMAYLKFLVDQRVANGITDLDLRATVRARSANSFDATSTCEACGSARMRDLFLHVLDQTLFTGPNAVYRPLTVVDCTAPNQEQVQLTVVPADGMGLEQKAVYALQYRNASRESEVRFSAVPGSFSGNTKGSFLVTGLAAPKKRFIARCRDKDVELMLIVPHAIFRPGGSSNGNVSSVSR